MVGDELMKFVLGKIPKVPQPGAEVARKIELVLDPGPLSEKLKKLSFSLATSTRLPSGVEIKKLYRVGAVDEFIAAVEKGLPEIGPIRPQIIPESQGMVIPQEAIVQLTRRVLSQAEAKK